MERVDRRQLLTAIATAGIGVLSGCGTQRGVDTDTRQPPTTRTPTLTPTREATPTPTDTASPDPTESPHSPTETPTPTSEQHDVIFVDEDVRQAVRKRVEAGDQPWFTAYQMLHADAESALNATPRSVVDNGAPYDVDDAHKYGTDAPYQGKDGVFSDEADRSDYFAALHMAEWIRNLGMAHGFSGRDSYAEKAIDLLHHWFVDPSSRMFPSAVNHGPHTKGFSGQNSIEHFITIPAMIYGAAYVRDHPYWDEEYPRGERKLEAWIRTYLDSLDNGDRHDPPGDGIYKWWLVNRAVAASYLDDSDALTRCFADWRTTAFKDFESRGTFKYARWRSRGLYYSFSALNALVLTAEIARHHGVDLYRYRKNGVNRLRTALDYHAPLLPNPSEWRWEELGGLERFEREFGGVAYELAYSIWNEKKYHRAIQASGRPIYDQRVLGWTTLSHGNRFELDV